MKVASELAFLKLKLVTLPPILAKFNQGLASQGRKLVDVYTLPGNQVAVWWSPGAQVTRSGSTVFDTDVTVVTETAPA